jgi:hypothetical protein
MNIKFPNKEYYTLFIIYSISLFLMFLVYIFNNNNKFISDKINGCIITYPSDITDIIIKNRGKNYNDSIYMKDCIFTYWHLSHFLLYVIIGFFCPNLFLLSISIGIIWEILEYLIKLDDITDIFFNIFGFIVGFLINKLVKK